MKEVQYRNIVVLCPEFNGYEFDIKNGLKNHWQNVELISYNEENVFRVGKLKYLIILLIRAIYYISFVDYKKSETYAKLENYIYLLCKNNFNSYIKKELDKKFAKENYDFALIIKGFGYSEKTINYIKQKTKVVTLYQWDPLVRYPNVLSTYALYDKIFTFQYSDQSKHKGSIYFPMFFKKQNLEDVKDIKIEQDLCFIGVFTLARCFRLNKIKRNAEKLGLKVNFKLYTKIKIFSYMFSDMVINEKLNQEDVLELYAASKVIVDLAHSGQEGITQRVFEALALGKGVFTETKDIEVLTQKHSVLNDYVFSFENMGGIIHFNPKVDISESIYKSLCNYELSNWCKKVST